MSLVFFLSYTIFVLHVNAVMQKHLFICFLSGNDLKLEEGKATQVIFQWIKWKSLIHF